MTKVDLSGDVAVDADNNDSNQADSSSNQNQDTTSDTNNSSNNAAPKHDNTADRVVKSAEQAKVMMINVSGGTGILWTATDTGSSYSVSDDQGHTGTVTYSGDITAPNGVFTSYSTFYNVTHD